jgi:hypothetical protein
MGGKNSLGKTGMMVKKWFEIKFAAIIKSMGF